MTEMKDKIKNNSKTIEFFKEISKIPRESGNEKKIAEYLCEFAKKRNLYVRCDEYNNVLIKKKTDDKPPIILQAHTDMVCEKENGYDFNFDTDSIEVIEEDGYLRANKTTLGADNGIGVAQILNILDSDLKCNIEAIFTTSEETTMVGAINFDTSELKGRYMINLDGFEENTIIIESSCFYDIIIKDNFKKTKIEEQEKRLSCYNIKLEGLFGGHSGFDINKNRGNSIQLLATYINEILKQNIVYLSEFSGGTKFNVIPSSAEATLVSNIDLNKLQEITDKFENNYQAKYSGLRINLKKIEPKEEEYGLDLKETKEYIQTILDFKEGVYNRNETNEPTTSVNLGVVNLNEHVMKIGMRSSKKKEEREAIKELKKYARHYNLEFNVLGYQPGFESNPNSRLIKTLLDKRPEKYKKEGTETKSVHITVEAGFFKEKILGLELAIISPNIQGAHTIKECVEIESIHTTDEWLYDFLQAY